jgi:hypothetical protein
MRSRRRRAHVEFGRRERTDASQIIGVTRTARISVDCLDRLTNEPC